MDDVRLGVGDSNPGPGGRHRRGTTGAGRQGRGITWAGEGQSDQGTVRQADGAVLGDLPGGE